MGRFLMHSIHKIEVELGKVEEIFADPNIHSVCVFGPQQLSSQKRFAASPGARIHFGLNIEPHGNCHIR